MMLKSSFQLIQKEQIEFLKFPKEDVLQFKEDQMIRFNQLKRAQSLGNLERQKVKIFFVDNVGLKKVETTIWAVTEKSVVLKKSTIIPLSRIVSVA